MVLISIYMEYDICVIYIIHVYIYIFYNVCKSFRTHKYYGMYGKCKA